MFDDTRTHLAALAAGLVLAFSSAAALGVEVPVTKEGRSPNALQARLAEAENSYKAGKVDAAIEQATPLVGVTDNSAFESDQVARDAKADLAVFQLKAGHPDQSAVLIRDLLMSLQLELPMDPRYSTDTAKVLAEAPRTLKDYFGKVIERLGEKPDTKLIIDSLINNTVPKDYLAQLNTYHKSIKTTTDELQDLQQIADSEELKYGDPLTSLEEADSENMGDPKLWEARLEKLGGTLDALATQAQNMPVGDLRAALGLYKLALAANSAQRYPQAEEFARKSIRLATALAPGFPVVPQIQVALAYALLKQGKTEEFKALRDDLLKRLDDRERLLVTLARFTESSGDDAGAAAIYKRALENRTKHGTAQPPEWMDSYNALLKKLGS